MVEKSELVSNRLDITYHETNEELEMKAHFHNSHEIIYVADGQAQFKINNKTYITKQNSIIFINNLESHQLKVTQYPYKRYFILIKPQYLQAAINEPVLASLLKHRPDYFKHVINLSAGNYQSILSIIENMYKEVTLAQTFNDTALGSWLQLLFINLYRNYTESFPLTSLNSSMDMVLEIQKYIEEHYMEQLSLKEISKLFYTDMYYLSHLFKKVTGFTFKEYLILQRISKAKDQLFYTTHDITQVGLNAGFNNVNHFIRIFKKFEKITPYQYRKKFR